MAGSQPFLRRLHNPPNASYRHPSQVAAASGKHVNSLRDAASKQGIIVPLEERVEVLNLFKAASDLHASAPSISIISTNKAARLLRKMKCLCAAGYFASLNKFEAPTTFHQPGTPVDDYLAPEAAVAVGPTQVCAHHCGQAAHLGTAVSFHLHRGPAVVCGGYDRQGPIYLAWSR